MVESVTLLTFPSRQLCCRSGTDGGAVGLGKVCPNSHFHRPRFNRCWLLDLGTLGQNVGQPRWTVIPEGRAVRLAPRSGPPVSCSNESVRTGFRLRSKPHPLRLLTPV